MELELLEVDILRIFCKLLSKQKNEKYVLRYKYISKCLLC